MTRLIAGLVGALVLTGCTAFAPATRSMALVGGEVMVTAPVGYCVDIATTRPADGFAVLAPCATLGAADPAPGVIAVATLQVGPPESSSIAGSEIAFRDFLITDAGTALLSRNSDAKEINILSTQAFDSRVMIHFEDAGPPPFAGLQREEWRAFTDINGRLVTIGLRGLAIAPLDDGPGAGLLKDVLAGVAAPELREPALLVTRAGG